MQDDDVKFCNFDTIVFVKPDEYRVVKCGTIYTVVGTCISVLLWDKEKRIGGPIVTGKQIGRAHV